jgi:hypothetical protein
MAITNFREPLPEDRLSEEERDKRIRIFDQFSKKLKTEMRAADFDDKSAIRQLLNYAGQRLKLLDLENRHARGLAKYDSLLGATAKPVSQGLIGVAVDAVLDFGLRDREKVIKNHEEDTEPLIAEISLLAPEIDKLLDQRLNPDKEDPVLRPSSCLPETATVNQLESSIFENAPKLLKPELRNSDEPQTDVVSEARTAGDQNANEDDQGNVAPALCANISETSIPSTITVGRGKKSHLDKHEQEQFFFRGARPAAAASRFRSDRQAPSAQLHRRVYALHH